MRILYLVLSLLISCAVPTKAAPDSSTYFWSTECQPLVLILDDTFSDAAISDIASAAEYWNSLLGTQVFVLFFTDYKSPSLFRYPHLHSRICGLVYMRNESPELPSQPNAAFAGFTTLLPNNPLVSNLHVGIVQISRNPLDTPYRMLTVSHELGHVLGLEHRYDTDQALMSVSLTNTKLILSTYELNKAREFINLR